MKPNIYEFNSYRAYLKERLEYLGPRSGLKRKAAESLQVHTTFISQVILGKAELSLDQGERMNSFLSHNENEAEFFLDLIIFERASDAKLKKRFETRLKSQQIDRASIKSRLNTSQELRPEDHERFYSSHLFGLLHVLSSLAAFQTRKALIAATGFPSEITNDAIDFLLRLGVLKKIRDSIVPGPQHIHLGKESKLIARHHTNWRMASIQKLAFADPTDLHYSLTFSCSEQDMVRIRESVLQHLTTLTKLIEKSKEEKAMVYCFDLYKWV